MPPSYQNVLARASAANVGPTEPSAVLGHHDGKSASRQATVNVDPDTAARDLGIPQALMRRFGHAECGIYAEVIRGGKIGVGDAIAVEEPRLS